MDNLQEQALEVKKMRSYVVIPPIPRDAKERKITYKNNNGFVADMEAEYKSRQYLNIWTPSEKQTFNEKFLQHSKNFGFIADSLKRKSAADCVQYYYLSKKTENYKQMIRKSRLRARNARNNPQKINNNNNNNNTAPTCVIDIMSTRVQTRLQREQQQKTVQQQQQQQSTSQETTSTTTVPSPPTTTTSVATSTIQTPPNSSSSSPAPASTAPSVISSAITATTSTTATITAAAMATGVGDGGEIDKGAEMPPESAADGKMAVTATVAVDSGVGDVRTEDGSREGGVDGVVGDGEATAATTTTTTVVVKKEVDEVAG